MDKWRLVKDDATHWHEELIPPPSTGWCCEFADQQRICLDCEDQPIWHAAMHCPICRGQGKELASE